MIDQISSYFPAKDKDEPQSLNVTFRSLKAVNVIFERTRIMRRESRIINYIPRQFQDRLRAVSEIDYNIRQSKKYQTRIRMGLQDIELLQKLRGTTKWEIVPLPSNLPPVNLNSQPPPSCSDSPPVGRPGHDYTNTNDNKRERESSGSDTDQNNSKVAKQNDIPKEVDNCSKEKQGKTWAEIVEKADLVREATKNSSEKIEKFQDPGKITSIQGTPVKLNPTLDYVKSPILTKSDKTK